MALRSTRQRRGEVIDDRTGGAAPSHRILRPRVAGAVIVIASLSVVAASCSADDTTSGTTTTGDSTTTDASPPPATTVPPTSAASVAGTQPAATTDGDSTAGSGSVDTAEGTTDSTAAPGPVVDTRYLDRYLEQGLVIDPFYPDALGGDIGYAEPACTEALNNLASFGAARGDVDANAVLASLQAVSGDLPSNLEPALRSWEGFIADHSDTYSGPFFAVSQGDLSEETLRVVLTDPGVVRMLDAYEALELIPPQDFVGFLDASCTSVVPGVATTSG